MMNEYELMRRPEVERMVGLSRSSIYAMMAAGAFPRPILIGKRAVRWQAATIVAWINERAENSKQ